MVNVFTIKEMVPMERYGFESSQLARQQLMKELSIKHQLIITNLHSFVPNFVEQMEGLGFDNFYHVILDLSDVARQKPSIAKEMLPSFQNVERVEYTKEGYVGLVYYEDGSIECYTSQLLFHFNSKEDIFTLYNSKGVLLEGNVREVYHAYRFTETGEVYSQWQLVSLYLSEHSTAKDKFIIDMINEYPLQLRKFFQNTKRELYSYTHYNILAPFMKFLLQNWCTNIVASPVLESRLGSEVVKFLPPVYVDEVKTEVYQEVRDWCIVGNMTIVKQCEMAIEAFRQVPESKLTIYGILPKGVTIEFLPENVTYAGFESEVPYEKHQGYLSCSVSECFANSAVEASAKGLVCLLSHTDLAHIYYASCCQQIKTFHSLNGLIESLRQFQNEGQYPSSDFAKLYTKEKVKEQYQQVLSLKR